MIHYRPLHFVKLLDGVFKQNALLFSGYKISKIYYYGDNILTLESLEQFPHGFLIQAPMPDLEYFYTWVTLKGFWLILSNLGDVLLPVYELRYD